MALSRTATAAIAAALSHTSAISSAGSPMMATLPIRWPSTVTATSRISTGGAISAVNQGGTASRAVARRFHRDGNARGIADHETDVAHRLQLRRQRRQELLGRQLLSGQTDRVLDKKIGKPHRRRHFDPGLHARTQDDHAAGN